MNAVNNGGGDGVGGDGGLGDMAPLVPMQRAACDARGSVVDEVFAQLRL